MNPRRVLSILFLFAGLTGMSGCSPLIHFGPLPPPVPGPAPVISSISPMSATAGGAGFTLTVNGSNFSSGATLGWFNPDNPGTFSRATTFVNATQLTAQVSAADLAIPSASVEVSVLAPVFAPPSNKVTFVINPGPPGDARAISTGANGAVPNGNSHDPTLSFNGRFVAFASEATNLVTPNTMFAEGYVRDTCLGVDPRSGPCTPSTLLVSAINGGTAMSPAEGNSLGGATPSIGFQEFSSGAGGIPPAGRYIGFLSTATNLVTPSTAFQQAFVRDTCFAPLSLPTCTPSTVLASVTQSGAEPNGAASEFIFANNSCHAAFVSAGTDVVSGVTTPNEIYLTSCIVNGPAGPFTTLTTPVSASTSGVPAGQGAQQPAISSDGRFVAFASTSTNLTSTPNGGAQQIYVRDTCTFAQAGCAPATIMVSVDSSGNALGGSSQLPAISDDGRFIVFSTLLPLSGGGNTNTVFLHDTCNSSSGPVNSCTPSTTTVSTGVGGAVADGPSSSTPQAVSGDGRFVVFSSSATNLIAGGNPAAQVFVRDTCNSSSGSVSGCTPSTVLISADSSGTPIGGFSAAISDDGHFAAFQTTVGSLVQVFFAATGF